MLAYRSTLGLLTTVDQEAAAQTAIASIESVLANLNSTRGSVRGYMITGDTAILPQYRAAIAGTEQALGRLKSAEYYARHRASIDGFDSLVRARLRLSEQRRVAYLRGGLPMVARTMHGDADDKRIEQQARSLQERIRGQATARKRTATGFARLTLTVIALGTILAVLSLIVAGWLFHREETEKQRAHRQTEEVIDTTERMKDELISVVGHELKTPLTSIRGALGLVSSGRLGTLNEQGMRMIEVAVAESDRLMRLINDMLDSERMKSGRIDIHPVTSDGVTLVDNAVAAMQALADRTGVRLETDTRPVPVWCDTDRIHQTLTNLISNAVKFSPSKAVVRVSVQKTDEGIEFRVSDHGPGIPQDKLETIFERFGQVDASDARKTGGAGLGLAIARSIVVRHGGRMWAESDAEHGSTFVFVLPGPATTSSEKRNSNDG